MKNQSDILLGFYGDDFTGSTDALEFITRAGAKAMLFLHTVSSEELQKYPALDVIGIAGMTRSLPPEEMENELKPAFEALKNSGAGHIHYKVCSTFDSSVRIGSIGKAIDVGYDIFRNSFIPVLGGTPALGRYCVFGNLFARMGIGSNGNTYRLDRHPSMSAHPVTPANESDLLLHLQQQTTKKGALINVLDLEKPVSEWNANIKDEHQFALVDTMYEDQLVKIGEWLAMQASLKSPVFVIGSSSVELALGSLWNKQQRLKPVKHWANPGIANPLLVVSGSCSPVTASQIAWAKTRGFVEIILQAQSLSQNSEEGLNHIPEIVSLLEQQRHVIVHTGTKSGENISSQKLGTALGTIARKAVESGFVKRVVIAGGDTSSYAARAMEINAVEMIAPIVSGAPLCKAYSSNPSINGLEVNLKGGQVGAENYFEVCVNGGDPSNNIDK